MISNLIEQVQIRDTLVLYDPKGGNVVYRRPDDGVSIHGDVTRIDTEKQIIHISCPHQDWHNGAITCLWWSNLELSAAEIEQLVNDGQCTIFVCRPAGWQHDEIITIQ